MKGRSKGDGKGRLGGRQKGTPNKTTSAIKMYINDVLADYMAQSSETGRPSLGSDIMAMTPEDRVKAVTNLVGYVIPKQQAISVDEQAKLEADMLTQWLEEAPDEAIDAIAAKVIDMQQENDEEYE